MAEQTVPPPAINVGMYPTAYSGEPDFKPCYQQQPMPMPQMLQPQTFGEFPQQAYCARCQANVMTRVEKVAGTFAWVIAIIIFVLGGGFLCLCFIPFCIDSCLDNEHLCPNCNTKLGKKARM